MPKLAVSIDGKMNFLLATLQIQFKAIRNYKALLYLLSCLELCTYRYVTSKIRRKGSLMGNNKVSVVVFFCAQVNCNSLTHVDFLLQMDCCFWSVAVIFVGS